jgi:hypothetical protein
MWDGSVIFIQIFVEFCQLAQNYVDMDINTRTKTRLYHSLTFIYSCPGHFIPRESPLYPLDRRMGESQSQSGCSDKEKKIPALAQNQTPAIQLVAQSLYWHMHMRACTCTYILKNRREKRSKQKYWIKKYRTTVCSNNQIYTKQHK